MNNEKKEVKMRYLHAPVSDETYIELKKAALDSRLTLRQFVKKMAEEYIMLYKKEKEE
jgi:hypothetical protein